MLSWKLWQALENPPYHYPLLCRIHTGSGWLSTLRDIPRPFLYATLLVAAYILWRIMPYTFGHVVLLVMAIPAVATLVLLISPLLFPLIMMGIGALWAANIGDCVVELQARGIYDLLCLLPGGQWAANWATACSSIHQSSVYRVGWIMVRGAAMVGLVLVLTLLSLVVVQLFSAGKALGSVVWLMLDVIALFTGQLLHYIQTMALTPLVGLLIPTYVHNRFEARLSAVGLYLGLQLSPFLICGLLFNLAPFAVSKPVDSGNSLTPYLFILFSLREASIMLLWIVLLRRLKLVEAEKKHLWIL
jgi:hypothetical protein